MAIYVASAAPVAENVVRVQFSEPFNQDYELYRRNNYALRTRFGVDIAVYAKTIAVVTTSVIDITLQDAMLEGGNYEVAVSGVSAISDGIRIEDGAGPVTAAFTGVGEVLGCFDIRRRVPPWLNTRFGSTMHAVLCATGDLLESLAGRSDTSAVSEAVKSLSIRTATGKDLGTIGANFGVSRPDFVASNDELFRKLIPIFSTKRKAVISIFYEALEAVFGPAATEGWAIYELEANVLTIELPADLFFGLAPGTLASATYLHDGPVDSTSTSVGAGFLADTTQNWDTNQWAGAILVDSGSTEFTIVSNTSTVLTVSGTPASGDYTILVPASSTYPGDYFCADASVAGSTIDDNIIILFQQTIVDDILSKLKASGIEIVVVVRG